MRLIDLILLAWMLAGNIAYLPGAFIPKWGAAFERRVGRWGTFIILIIWLAVFVALAWLAIR